MTDGSESRWNVFLGQATLKDKSGCEKGLVCDACRCSGSAKHFLGKMAGGGGCRGGIESKLGEVKGLHGQEGVWPALTDPGLMTPKHVVLAHS